MYKFSDFDFGWLVGILDGEGTFILTNKKRYPRISVKMTDVDTIDRFAKLVEREHSIFIDTKITRMYGWKKTHRVDITGRKAVEIMKLIYPHMSGRRKERIQEILIVCSKNKSYD